MTGLVWGPEGGSCGWIGGMCWRGHAQDGEREQMQRFCLEPFGACWCHCNDGESGAGAVRRQIAQAAGHH